jgi:hypothetical protein
LDTASCTAAHGSVTQSSSIAKFGLRSSRSLTSIRSAQVRADVAGSLEFTGLRLSRDADQSSVPDRVISAPDSAVAVLVVHAREDLMVLDEVLRLTDVISSAR